MRSSTHYYVLSLGKTTSAMFEAFRDSLIVIENQGFPVVGPVREADVAEHLQWRGLARTVDRCFGRYYASEPLSLVVVGAPEMQEAFWSVTDHDAAIIGRVDGDHTGTSARDLGQIVWPIVKEVMSGVLERAMHDLEDLATQGRVASGLEAVVQAAGRDAYATLLVEDGYHLRGSIGGGERNVDVDTRLRHPKCDRRHHRCGDRESARVRGQCGVHTSRNPG